MSKPSEPKPSPLPVISLFSWKPDLQLMDKALGKKPDKKSDRGKGS